MDMWGNRRSHLCSVSMMHHATHLARSALVQVFRLRRCTAHFRDHDASVRALSYAIISPLCGKRRPPHTLHAVETAEGVRWQDSLGKIEPCWILQIKVADTRTNHTAGFWSVHATPGRAHTARMYILMFYVSVFLTGYTAWM